MARIDRLASVRIAQNDAQPTLFEATDGDLSPLVPPHVGQEEPQKSAVSHASHASHRRFSGATQFPLTNLIVELMRHPDPWRADPVNAAEHFGLKVEVTQYYIQQERARRGI